MKLKGDKTGRKGHLSVATEVLALAPCSVLQLQSVSYYIILNQLLRLVLNILVQY